MRLLSVNGGAAAPMLLIALCCAYPVSAKRTPTQGCSIHERDSSVVVRSGAARVASPKLTLASVR